MVKISTKQFFGYPKMVSLMLRFFHKAIHVLQQDFLFIFHPNIALENRLLFNKVGLNFLKHNAENNYKLDKSVGNE